MLHPLMRRRSPAIKATFSTRSLSVPVKTAPARMFAKLLILSCVAALTLSREYPAGVHPAVCPDYPFCDAATLARFTPDGMPIPEWGLYPGLVRAVAPVEVPAGVPAAPRYPADFNAALCPNYPYCW